MTAADATWLVGATYFATTQNVVLDGTSYGFAAGDWFLRSATAAESLLDQLETHMGTEGITTPDVHITRRRTVVISAGATFAVTWSSSELQAALGFTGNLSGQSSYEATYPSPLLFSPGFVVTKTTPDGTPGYDVEDERLEISRDGTQRESTMNNTQVWEDLHWSDVVRARVWKDRSLTDAAWGGTWERFREVVLVPNRLFKLHEQITEDDSSATEVTWDTALGTYGRRKLPSSKLNRDVAATNTHWSLGLEVIRDGA